MRKSLLIALAGCAACALPVPAQAQGRADEQQRAYRDVRRGSILPLNVIRTRVNIPGAQFIGAELIGERYRLRYMRGSNVIWVEVDARTGQVVGGAGF